MRRKLKASHNFMNDVLIFFKNEYITLNVYVIIILVCLKYFVLKVSKEKNESLRLWCISNVIFFMISLVLSLRIFIELKEIFKLKEIYAPINSYPNSQKLNRSKLLFESQRCHIINPMDSSFLLGKFMFGPLEAIPPSPLHTHWGKRQLYCWLFNT